MAERAESFSEFVHRYGKNVRSAPLALRTLGWACLLLAPPAAVLSYFGLVLGHRQVFRYAHENAWLCLFATGVVALTVVSARSMASIRFLRFWSGVWIVLAAWDLYLLRAKAGGNPFFDIDPVRIAWELTLAAIILLVSCSRRSREFVSRE